MLYNLIQSRKGKQTIVMTDNLTKVNNRLKTLRNSQRKGIKGEKVIYTIAPTDNNVKFRQKPHDGSYLSGDHQIPKKVT